MKKLLLLALPMMLLFLVVACNNDSKKGSTTTNPPSEVESKPSKEDKSGPESGSSSESKDSEESNESSSASNSKTDCSKFLVEYENFINDYVTLMKKVKANPSDVSLIKQSTQFMQRADSYGKKVETFSGDCNTSEFLEKYSAITQRLTSAMSDMTP